MKFDQIQPARFLIRSLKLLGLWEFNSEWIFIYNVYSYTLHFIFTILNFVSLWLSVITSKSLEGFSESAYMSLTETALVTKVLNMLNLRREAVHFFEMVQSEDFSLKNSEEIQIFKSSHRVFYFVLRFYIYASVAVVGVNYSLELISRNPKLPYPGWMPFEMNSSNFWYAFVFQFLALCVTCLANVTIDMLQCYFLHHVSLIYRVIAYRLENIGLNIEGGDSDNTEVNEIVLYDLREIVKVHSYVMRITSKCEELMVIPLFMQILLSAVILCFSGYQLQSMSLFKNPGQFVSTADFLLVMGLQIFLPCYYASQVTIESNKLSEALYNSNWIALPKISRRVILLYMLFLKEPVTIKGGIFFKIGLPLFAKTLNNAYSFFALLVRMKK